MKISKEDKLIVSVFAILVFFTYCTFNFFRQNIEFKELKSVNDKLILEKFKEFANQKKTYEIKAKQSDNNADSVLRIVSSLEKQLKQTQIFYSKKIKSIEKINTYNSRQSYADSLYRSMR